MSKLNGIFTSLRRTFSRRRFESEMAEEIRHHIEAETERRIATGEAPLTARRRAAATFGSVDARTEEVRDRRIGAIFEELLRNLQFGLRSLAKTPSFTIIALLTLTLGIGLNTAMFSFVNSLYLRPLPYPDSDQLVTLFRTTQNDQSTQFTTTEFHELKRDEGDIGHFAAFQPGTLHLDNSADEIPWVRMSVDLFEVLGTSPRLGRMFRPEECVPGRHHVAVISDGVWRDNFNRASDVIGQTIRGNGEIYEIVGVLSATSIEHRLFGKAGIFTPLISEDNLRANHRLRLLTIIGRRSSDVSEEQENLLIERLGARIEADNSQADSESAWRSQSLVQATSGTSGKGIGMVFMLFGLSTCVLAIACSNLANLLMARTIERSHEFAVRLALGASRRQMITPLAVESALLAIVGGTGALLVVRWTTDWLDSAIQSSGGAAFGFTADWRVLGFTFLATLTTLVFFGTAPAFFASRINVNNALKSGARGSIGGRSQQRFRNALIVAQFAFTMILLAGAGYFLQGSHNMMNRPHGWNSEQVVQGKLSLPVENYPDSETITSFYQRFSERLQSLPGVESVSFSDRLPFLGLRGRAWYVADSSAAATPTTGAASQTNHVTPSYFSVTRSPLISGRLIDQRDTAASPPVMVISESMARRVFGKVNPLGRRISLAKAELQQWSEIVGVVGDVQSADVSDNPSNHQVYLPLSQNPQSEFTFGIRTKGVSLGAVIESVRFALTEIDPRLTSRNLMPVERAILVNTSAIDIGRKILTAFAGLGLFLAALGNYGVIAQLVAMRTSELGIRMALGAQIADVIRLVIVSGMRLSLIGAGMGLFGAWGLSQGIRSMFPSIQIDNILVLAGAISVMLLVAFVACWIPARNAGRIDPIQALRNE